MNCVLNNIDYSDLSNKDFTTNVFDFNYTLSICSPLKNSICNSKDSNVNACMLFEGVPYILSDYSTQKNDKIFIYNSLNNNCWNGGVFGVSTVGVNLNCNDVETLVLNSNNNCFYNFTLFSPKICKENLNTEIVNNLSTGWIILIVLFVITIFYTIFGFLYNTYRKNKTGFEACPHKNFWCEIPSLVKDGCIYSYNKIYQLKNQEVKEKVKEESGYGSL